MVLKHIWGLCLISLLLVGCQNGALEASQTELTKKEALLKKEISNNEALKEDILELNRRLELSKIEVEELNNSILLLKEEKEEFAKTRPSFFDREAAQALILEAVEIGDGFEIGIGVGCDYTQPLEGPNGRTCYKVTEEGLGTMKDLENYILRVYTEEALEAILRRNNRYIEIKGALYCMEGEIGGPTDWAVELPILLDYDIDKKSLVFQAKGYNRMDEGEKSFELKDIEVRFEDGQGYRINTFMSSK